MASKLVVVLLALLVASVAFLFLFRLNGEAEATPQTTFSEATPDPYEFAPVAPGYTVNNESKVVPKNSTTPTA